MSNIWIKNDIKPEVHKWVIVKDKQGKIHKNHQWNGMCWYDYIIDKDGCDGWRSNVDVEYWKYKD